MISDGVFFYFDSLYAKKIEIPKVLMVSLFLVVVIIVLMAAEASCQFCVKNSCSGVIDFSDEKSMKACSVCVVHYNVYVKHYPRSHCVQEFKNYISVCYHSNSIECLHCKIRIVVLDRREVTDFICSEDCQKALNFFDRSPLVKTGTIVLSVLPTFSDYVDQIGMEFEWVVTPRCCLVAIIASDGEVKHSSFYSPSWFICNLRRGGGRRS
ncbi:MAG: hypothetical protein Harvfovirus6_26 [Harvfovirus sp.]|uniref:Uncharacterized protein n=1 Tax=Harvfovirus sp. TaxID=2487768 RepID=A0A3G5A0M5_9VIRU|nr:MAG: hypothetical protein Harvfovirus6_26 [Harvfovirus sp.]